MIETQEPVATSPARRHRWVMPFVVAAVAVAGIGVGVALANRDDSPSAPANSSQLADINQACTTWMNNDARSGATQGTWCQDMTGWMSQQMSNGSMMGSMMWGDPDQMLATCRSWMTANPASDRPGDWCDSMLRGMWPYMNGNWDDWDVWMNGPMMGGN